MAEPERSSLAYVALGSNLGDRCEHLLAAVAALDAHPACRVVLRSRLYETAPVGPPQGEYLNAAIAIETTLSPQALLLLLQAVERDRGRERGVPLGPRTLDLDLLLHADTVLDLPGLQVPHPRMQERAFVLLPLEDIAAAVVHPVLRRRIDELAEAARDPRAARIREEDAWRSSQ